MFSVLALALSLAAAPAGRVDSVRADQDVRESVLRNAADVRRCYEHEGLRRDPALSGTLEVEITILPNGTVEKADVATAAMTSAAGRDELGACIATAARHWRFERGPFGVQTVVFPFALAPASRPTALERTSANS